MARAASISSSSELAAVVSGGEPHPWPGLGEEPPRRCGAEEFRVRAFYLESAGSFVISSSNQFNTTVRSVRRPVALSGVC
jgi:hypothetical protein